MDTRYVLKDIFDAKERIVELEAQLAKAQARADLSYGNYIQVVRDTAKELAEKDRRIERLQDVLGSVIDALDGALDGLIEPETQETV